MAKSRGLFTLLLTIGLSQSIAGQCLTGNDNPAISNQNANKLLINGKLNFTLEALKQAALLESKDNLFFSPHSLHEALVLAYFGARGTTEESLKKALRIPDSLSKVDVQRSYALEKSLKEFAALSGNVSTNYEFKTANRLWISDSKKIRDCMLSLFQDELEKVDFRSNPGEVRNRINGWVSNITKGHIQDLLSPDAIDETTDLVLTNAVYFKGLWGRRFDAANNKKDIFYGSKNSIVTYMKQKSTFNYMVSEELGAHVIELPYKGDEISMYIFLPPFVTTKARRGFRQVPGETVGINRDGIQQLIERMTSTDRGIEELHEILDRGMLEREVELSLPRFSVEKELPVSSLLRSLGAEELMEPGRADLRGFLENTQDNLHLGDAVHRAKIEVNEEGTTAAGATAIFTFRSSRPTEPAIFNANHPFVYLIYEKPSQSIIFTGIYRTPTSPAETTN
ncbi:serine protease inhibitor 88Ea isoform X1 [Microplitis demolitor]|uniref:serine protease inhibitor 88Ea isoform X1 n=1 Tax=Microplitis demolitor TaxID=69319 RepID=UPI0004CDB633|nr:serine protease inhibitor 88Ea isoform X1 [Microplitis demolitor]